VRRLRPHGIRARPLGTTPISARRQTDPSLSLQRFKQSISGFSFWSTALSDPPPLDTLVVGNVLYLMVSPTTEPTKCTEMLGAVLRELQSDAMAEATQCAPEEHVCRESERVP
jgi:hypothetical protein